MKKGIALLFLISLNCFSQFKVDSLLGVWKNKNLPDSARYKAINTLSWDVYLYAQPDTAYAYAEEFFQFAKSKGNKKQMALALNTQATTYAMKGDYDNSIKLFFSAFNINKEINDLFALSGSYSNIALVYNYKGELTKSVQYYVGGLNVCVKSKNYRGVGSILNSIGLVYMDLSNYKKAIEYFNMSLLMKRMIKDEVGISQTYNNLGLVYGEQGNHAKAIEYYTESLRTDEKRKNIKGIAAAYNNIGLVYQDLGELDKALEFYLKSLKIQDSLHYNDGSSASLNNIGNIYSMKEDYKNALEYHFKSLKIREEAGDQYGIAGSLTNIGSTYLSLKKTEEALNYFEKSLKVQNEIGDRKGVSVSFNNIGDLYAAQKNYRKAIQYNSDALAIAKEVGAAKEVCDAAGSLWEVYKKTGDTKKALEMYELHISYRDSITSEDNNRALIKQEFKYQYEKQAAADSVAYAKEKQLSQAQIEKHQAEIKVKRNQQYGLFGGLFLVIVFSLVMYNRFKLTQKQKAIIEEQKHIVEEKNTEIVDSINYAKRIQTAILPPQRLIKQHLPQSFVLYKPKDIVAGDFYWLETTSSTILFAAADCTGHGVPGAMVSVVCNNALNRTVREYHITEPGKILDKAREIVITEFEKSEEEVKDGMDISLLSINMKTKELLWSGANNPLWIIRNEKSEIEEIKADKQPIGKYAEPRPFTTHNVQLQEGDSVYVFTDGYQDQFGGPKGKKFKAAQMKEILLAIQDKTMEEQKTIMYNKIEEWKGITEQIDDICLIGVKI